MVPGPELRPPSQDGPAARPHLCQPVRTMPCSASAGPLAATCSHCMWFRRWCSVGVRAWLAPVAPLKALAAQSRENPHFRYFSMRRAGPESKTGAGRGRGGRGQRAHARKPDTAPSPGKRTGAHARSARLRGASRQREQPRPSQVAPSRAVIGSAILCGPAQGTGHRAQAEDGAQRPGSWGRGLCHGL